MTRAQARKILGRQPKWALRNMALALQMHSWHNNRRDWTNLQALKTLGYKVTIDIPTSEERAGQ